MKCEIKINTQKKYDIGGMENACLMQSDIHLVVDGKIIGSFFNNSPFHKQLEYLVDPEYCGRNHPVYVAMSRVLDDLRESLDGQFPEKESNFSHRMTLRKLISRGLFDINSKTDWDNFFYDFLSILEDLENMGVIRGNGHHMRQELGSLLSEYVINRLKPSGVDTGKG